MFSLALSVILSITLLQVVPVATTGPAGDFEPGFNCEKGFISDAEITNALIISKMANPKFPSPNPYHGPLFRGERLLMYPVITHKWPEERESKDETYSIVYQNPGKVVGVFAITQYNEHLPCRRNVFTPHTPPAPVPNQSLLHMNVVITGFQCAQDEIENELILSKLVFTTGWCKRRSDRYARYDPFPEPIPGMEGTNLIWLLADKDHPNLREENKYGSFVQVSSMLLVEKHERCIVKTIPNSHVPTLSRNPPRNLQMGYICDIFFGDDYISSSAIAAREQDQISVYPKIEKLGSTMGEVLLWPVYPSGNIIKQGRHSRYFLVMSKDFHVLRVLRHFRFHGYKNCPREGIEKDQEPEISDFICDNYRVANEHLSKTAKISCNDISTQRYYPKIYQGPRFDVIGPYLISKPIAELSS
ncbi:putative ribonuclease f1 [Golovinomyces cichoracearum]|uniref:Putative ribonuclease f1 n=1 Tax=Golovinomyces cichoracearum TaxID=62708 RepID=A0A420J2X6_9PEZI|nr:putative ribonuclease f1 [Golovinomyces cichoracearum]